MPLSGRNEQVKVRRYDGDAQVRPGASERIAFRAVGAGAVDTVAILALSRLVLGKSPINSVGRQIFLPNVAAEIGAIDFGRPSLPADPQRLHAGGLGLAHFVRQHERGLVLHVEFAGQRQHALALHLVTEGSDREQISS